MGTLRLMVVSGWLLACAQPLELPPEPRAPILTSFAPEAAFVGEVVAIKGSNFAANAADNRVLFTGASAAASGFAKDGALLVTVPDGALDGPIAVSVPLGQSEAIGNFHAKGFGRLRRGELAATLTLRHDARALAASSQDVFLPSALFRVLMSRGGLLTQLPSKPFAIAISPDEASVFLAFDDDGIWRVDATTGAVAAKLALSGVALRKLVATGSVVYALGSDGSRRAMLYAFQASDLSGEKAGRALPLVSATGFALTPDGTRLLVTGVRQGEGGLQNGVLLVNPQDAADAGSFVPSGAGRQTTGALATFVADGKPRAAVAFDDGAWWTFDLGTRTWSGSPVPTGAAGAVADLLAVTANGQALVVVSKSLEGSVAAFDAASGERAWETSLHGSPTVLAATKDGKRIFAAGNANAVDELDAADGRWLGRSAFDVGLGTAPGNTGGVVVDNLSDPPRTLVLARRTKQLMSVDRDSLDLNKPRALVQDASAARGIVKTSDGRLWVLHEKELGLFDGKKESLQLKDLAEPPAFVELAKDGRLVVASRSGAIDVYRDNARTGGSRIPGALIDLVTVRDDGSVLVAWSALDGSGWRPKAAVWSVDALQTNAIADRTFTGSPDFQAYVGPVGLAAGTLLLYKTGPDGGEAGVMLDGSLAATPVGVSPVKEPGPLATSPDGRAFVWARRLVPDQTLRQVRVGEGGALTEEATMPVPGLAPSGAAYTPSGERLFVPVPGADVLAIYE